MLGRTTVVRGRLPKSSDGPAGRLWDPAGMHSRTLESLALIAEAVAVDLVAFSRDGDPLAVVEIPRREAERLVGLPEAMGHVFRADRRRGGRVEVGAFLGRCPADPSTVGAWVAG